MESKTARLTVLIDPAKKKALERLCASQDLTPSQVVRQLIRDYLAEHGVCYGPETAGPGAPEPVTVRNPVVTPRSRTRAVKVAKNRGLKT